MEPPKFRIKKVGEEFPVENKLTEAQIDEKLPDLESINEATNNQEADIPEVENKCINCDVVLEQNTVICIACGTNQASGKGLKTKSIKQKKKKFKQKVYKAKKPMDAWLVNLIIFAIMAVPLQIFITSVTNKMNQPSDILAGCKEKLHQFNANVKSQSSYYCHIGDNKNFDLYKPINKAQVQSPNFVKAYCSKHKHGINAKGLIVKVSKPVGKKVKVPKKFQITQASADNVAMGFTLLLWGTVLNLTARFSFCHYALKDGIATFLCCLLIPFYNILFWLRNRENVGPSFTCGIVSAIMIFLGGFCIVASSI